MKLQLGLLLPMLAIQTIPAALAQSHPIVFIDGNGSELEAAKSTPTIKRHDQTIELAQDLLKSCPEISLIRRDDVKPDYYLLLNRGEEYGLFKSAVSQVMLMDGDKNVLYAHSEGTVAKAAKDGCKAIMADRRNHDRRERFGAQSDTPSPWNKSEGAKDAKQ